jgi:hypothetical protein
MIVVFENKKFEKILLRKKIGKTEFAPLHPIKTGKSVTHLILQVAALAQHVVMLVVNRKLNEIQNLYRTLIYTVLPKKTF